MGADEKNLCQRLAQAVEMLTNDKREFILGYAEGVIAATGEPRVNANTGQDSA